MGKRQQFAPMISETAVHQIVEATSETRPTDLLREIIDDVETMESLRFTDRFDMTRLNCYRRADTPDKKQEIFQLCKEYIQYLHAQHSLNCRTGAGLYKGTNQLTFTLVSPDEDLDNFVIRSQYDRNAIQQQERSHSLYDDCLRNLHSRTRLAKFYFQPTATS